MTKHDKNKHETEKKIPLAKYVHFNKRGKPCSQSWKIKLVNSGNAPFKWVKEDDNTYVLID
jgi:hypothetical protein